MASLTIHNLDPQTQDRLRLQAALHGRSIEDEAAVLLREKLEESTHPQSQDTTHILYRIRTGVEKHGAFEVELPSRKSVRPPFEFDQ